MELISQHTKNIMEGCKERARDAGLHFQDQTLEYIVTNRDLLELSPKLMIPTLYDYWVHDVEVLREKGKYELYPSNPYETVINTRPAISFYNDNNPDWLNVMIFYHVLAHIDFFQNNLFFRNTWNYDFNGQALSDKRAISKLRSDKGRWVDYVIEFTRGIDNLVGYFENLSSLYHPSEPQWSKRLNFYFDVFLQRVRKVKVSEYVKEIERYNACMEEYGKDRGEEFFFLEVNRESPEFEALFEKSIEEKRENETDLMQYIMARSGFLNKEENRWMKIVMQVVRKTSLFFQPQIRTKIMNEGWASYWHEILFMKDDRIQGHEVDFARVNAKVTAMPRVGLNPYALGMRLFYFIEETADKGRFSIKFERIRDVEERKKFDMRSNNGRDFIFQVREDFSDFSFINTFLEDDFIRKNKLFVSGRRLNRAKGVWEYYVKSRDPEIYRNMLLDSLYHPPHVEIDEEKGGEENLYLVHRFEGKPLVKDFIENTLMGIEFLWGGPVHLETSEPISASPVENRPASAYQIAPPQPEQQELQWKRVLYTMQERKLSRKPIISA
ncbi:MAG TPA: SpoVR family protein [Desulfobacteria bacterium]|nr:SpoVR family protein [Desulfobacteria bacterium]